MYAIVGKFRLVIPIAYAWRCFKLQGTGEEMFEVTKLKLELCNKRRVPRISSI